MRMEKDAVVNLDPQVSAAIDRLRLAAEVQDVTGMSKPPRLRGRQRRERWVRWLLSNLRARPGGPSLSRRFLLRALNVAALGLRGWRLPSQAPGPSEPDPVERTFAGFVTSSQGEEQVVRLSLLLRLMKRQRQAVDLLVDRVRSTAPNAQSRLWLAHFLRWFKEDQAAALLLEGSPSPAPPLPPSPAHRPPRLRYGIIMLTMFDSEIFRSSLRSLVHSDFSGRILVVEDGYEAEETCREFCETMPVTYMKMKTWEGSAAAMNAGLTVLADTTDIVTFVHNDVLWPPTWFHGFDAAWESTFDSGKVGLLNLGYVQFKRKLDAALYELFIGGEYRHLEWILSAVGQVSALKNDRIQDAQVRPGERLFGLSRDPWNHWMPDARFMTGRFSVAASFPVSIWRALGGFEKRMPYGFDLELQHYCLANRRWILFTNNSPLIHLASSDTRAVDHARRQANPLLHDTYPVFEEKYGWNLEHFINVYFSETAFIYEDEIVRAANALRFEDIDFVFDDFQRRLRERTLANCELTWCRSRTTCKYPGPAPAAVAAPTPTASGPSS